MKQHFRTFAAFFAVTLTMLACSSSFEVVKTQTAPPDQSKAQTEQPANGSQGLLPHTFYHLANGQVFRMERDGRTLTQLTHESVNVTDYDVSRVDGSIAYVAGNQLLLANADGANRHVLVDGGSKPVFSPDGRTLAYRRNGLDLYDLSTRISDLVFADHPLDGSLPPETYSPDKFSPDGTKLLIKIGHPPDSPYTAAIYSLTTKVLMQFAGSDESLSCCTQYGGAEWSADSSSFYAVARVPDSSFPGGELWKVDANAGAVRTLIPISAGNGAFNVPYRPYLAPNGNLYFFYNTAISPDGGADHPRLQIVRTASDGVTNQVVLRPDIFELTDEALWAPDASFVIVAFASSADVSNGGQAEILYLDGRPNVTLTTLAQQMKWGP